MGTAPGDLVAVVPLKALDRAKGRLAPHLDRASRRELTAWMFSRVVRACQQSAHVAEVLVVAGDEAAAGLARVADVAVIIEPRPGLHAAMATADRLTAAAAATLVLAADLPLARARDLDAVCRAGNRHAGVVVAPTRDGGTGALLRRPPTVIPTAYGAGSAAAHLRAAAAAGVRGVRVDVPALSMDVDTVAHLRAVRRQEARRLW